ncbi:uncharacterized protein BX663DRAFT_508258 [Cokeromyces recurvatus]|uniref:uncharacterized protein n=1 Tax=Cokeromyces recurvatus TaxID=90255 RepID=UPI0022209117|nr:uncharacterized protein BX663DRAFT_508258 [Cokeromyces recurvatus]KAI7903336.1 hypothetical protein BX663DRAFT_508258 [Cokeromyces recurvatus]
MTQTKIQVFYSDDELLHNPTMELTSGEWKPYVESPERLKSIKAFIDSHPSDFEIVSPFDYSINPILDIHRHDYIQFLKTIYKDWIEMGLPKDACMGDTFAKSSFTSHLDDSIIRENANKSCEGKMGYYLGDMSVSFVKDTWSAVYASAQIILSAAHRLVETNKPVYALCRPPGHHASHYTAAGYCFINNVAVATRFLQNYSPEDMKKMKRPYHKVAVNHPDMILTRMNNDKKRILIIDIDFHHGNGTQSIFYHDPSVFYISLHGYPNYPYFTGSTQEIGKGPGEGYNINVPLDPNTTTDAIYLSHLDIVLNDTKVINFDAQIVIVSMGLDTWHEDPIAGLKGLQNKDTYNKIGSKIKTSKSTKNRSVLFVQEGGYTMSVLGELAGRVLQGYLQA